MVESDWLYCGIGLQEVPKTEQSNFTMIPNCKFNNINGSCALDFNPTQAAGGFVFRPHLVNLPLLGTAGPAPDSAARISSAVLPGCCTQRNPRPECRKDKRVPVSRGPLRPRRSVRWRSCVAGMQANCTEGSLAPKTEMIKVAGARFHDEREHTGCGVPK